MSEAAKPVAGQVDTDSPTWAIVGELSDDAIDALADLLIESVTISPTKNNKDFE